MYIICCWLTVAGSFQKSEIPDGIKHNYVLNKGGPVEVGKTDLSPACFCIITAAIKHINCHAELDPASRPIPDSRFHENDGFDIYCCRSNNRGLTSHELQPGGHYVYD